MDRESYSFVKRGFQEQLQSENIDEKDERRRVELTVPLATQIPVIDHRQLVVAATEADLSELRSALTSWGCFQLVNHGIERSLIDEVRRISKEFFQMPLSERKKYAAQNGDDEGYGTDELIADDQFPDWSHSLGLHVRPEHRQKPKYWPQNPHSFRKVLVEYSDKLKEVKDEIVKLVGKTLKLGDEDWFVKKTGDVYAQFNYYPACPNPERVLGLRQHSDFSVITFLVQDDQVGGLQLLKDDKWFAAPTMRHALLVFAGDQLEIMSNGIFKSCVHRVVRESSEKERCTLAMFFTPDCKEEIGPLDELLASDRPRLFQNVSNYVAFSHSYFYQGKRPINELRI